MRSPPCIVVLCGEVASGKTTLARELASLKTDEPESELWCVSIDGIYASMNAAAARSAADFDALQWKQARRVAMECVESLLDWFGADERETVSSLLSCSELQHHVDAGGVVRGGGGGVGSSASSDGDASLATRLTVVVDDNMYYRSMRRAYYCAARKRGAGFLQVLCEAPASVRAARNAARATPVPIAVAERVAALLAVERPDPATRAWERNTVTLATDGGGGGGDDAVAMALAMPCRVGSAASVWRAVAAARAAPLVDPTGEELAAEERRAEARRVLIANVVHSADKLLRREVTRAIKACVTAAEKKVLAPQCNAARKAILASLRDGTFTFDGGAEDAEEEEGGGCGDALEAEVVRAFAAEIK